MAWPFKRSEPLPPGLGKKLVWIAVLYFGQGFPFGIAYDVWPVYFRVHGVSLKDIGLMALLFLPYTLKPAWAPLADRFGSRQAWVAACQFALAGLSLAMLALDPTRTDWLLWAVLLAFTFASATQDISIDAYAVDVAEPRETGLINGLRVSVARTAYLAGGGGLLLLADRPWSGWRGAWVVAAGLFVLSGILALASPRVPREHAGRRPAAAEARGLARYRIPLIGLAAALVAAAYLSGWQTLWLTLAVLAGTLVLVSFFDPEVLAWGLKPAMLPVLAFVLLYKLGDSTLGRMVKPFWVDTGMTSSEIGVISVWVGAALTFAGAMLGGWYIHRKGIFKALLWMGVGQLVSNFGYVAVAALHLHRGDAVWLGLSIGPHQAALYGASMIESITQGLGTAAFGAFLMNLCDRTHAATQYALLSATFSLSRDVVGAFSGIGVEHLGYPTYFTITAFIAIPGLALLPWIKGRIREDGEGGGGPHAGGGGGPQAPA
jgi:MFS transporter, PAT family, beta-lactamase induction signal transducer AmpG